MTESEALRLPVDLAHIAAVRHAVADFAAWSGLTGRRRGDFVLAVNELVTNVVRHGGGVGDVRLGRTDEAIWCEVVDRGPGLPAERRGNHQPLPPASDTGGRGLWLVHRLSDLVTVSTGASGTRIRILNWLSGARPAPR